MANESFTNDKNESKTGYHLQNCRFDSFRIADMGCNEILLIFNIQMYMVTQDM